MSQIQPKVFEGIDFGGDSKKFIDAALNSQDNMNKIRAKIDAAVYEAFLMGSHSKFLHCSNKG